MFSKRFPLLIGYTLLIPLFVLADTSSNPSQSSTTKPHTSLNNVPPLSSTSTTTSPPNPTNTPEFPRNDTKIYKLQLSYNTSRCLNAILDAENYAQEELTIIPNCSEKSTNWAIPINMMNEDIQSPDEIICRDCEDWPILDGGFYANMPNRTLLNERDQPEVGNLGQSWIIGKDKRIYLTNSLSTGKPLCLSERNNGTTQFEIRTEYCGIDSDYEGSSLNQIWNFIEVPDYIPIE